MKLKQFDIEAIKPHPENYNRHPESQLTELVKSLDQFDQFKNIVVWNGLIIAGNGLYEAAKRKGLKKIYAIDRSDLSESQAKALLIADNATNAISEPDLSQLKVLLDGLDDIEIPGVNDDFFEVFNLQDLFKPNLNPNMSTKQITQEDIEKTQKDMDNKFNEDPELIELLCPHCCETFSLEKKDIIK